MVEKTKINKTEIKLIKDDLTNLDVEAFVFYARPDLELGSGYGNAISTRGGISIKEELSKIGSVDVTESVITEAGLLKAKHIIHCVGPTFQEENINEKYINTIKNLLILIKEKGLKQVAVPMLGMGFYGVSTDFGIDNMYKIMKDFISKDDTLEEIIICANDNREYRLLAEKFEIFNNGEN